MSPTFGGVEITIMAEDDQPDYGKWLIHGPQGAGKTTLMSTLAQIGPMLFIDLIGEHGTQAFKGAPWEKNVTVLRPETVTALDDIYWELAKGDHPYLSVGVDSATSVQRMAMRYILGYSETAVREIKQGVAPADKRAWGQTLDIMTDFATFWYGLADSQRAHPMHVAVTAQTKMLENEETGFTSRTPDVQKGALSLLLAAPAYVVYADVEDNLDHLADPNLPAVNHIVRFGANPAYRTKGRVPYHLRGKIPPVLGRKRPTSLVELSRVLGIGGIPHVEALRTDATTEKESAA